MRTQISRGIRGPGGMTPVAVSGSADTVTEYPPVRVAHPNRGPHPLPYASGLR
jgi:hypothetical protein